MAMRRKARKRRRSKSGLRKYILIRERHEQIGAYETAYIMRSQSDVERLRSDRIIYTTDSIRKLRNRMKREMHGPINESRFFKSEHYDMAIKGAAIIMTKAPRFTPIWKQENGRLIPWDKITTNYKWDIAV